MDFLFINFTLPDPSYSFETSEKQLTAIIYILSIMQTGCTQSLDTHCLVSGKAFAEKEVLSLMEPQ